MSICPILSVGAAIATAVGYTAESTYDMRRVGENTNYGDCMADACALWNADYGCGLSTNITDVAKRLHVEAEEQRIAENKATGQAPF